jgi:hypothetical protein
MKNLIIFLSLVAAIAVGCTKIPDTPVVGKSYQGGIVFELPSNGNDGLIYAKENSPTQLNFPDAERYCSNYSAGGYKDWRLPTCNEMDSIYKTSYASYISCSTCANSLQWILFVQFWTGDSYDSEMGNVFDSGECIPALKQISFQYVRPVRNFK